MTTTELQQAIDAAAARGGDTVTVPAGRHLIGPIQLRSRVTLHLEPEAVLAGSPVFADYPLVSTRWEGAYRQAHQPLLWARQAEQIAITGSGTIDGQGAGWWTALRAGLLPQPRPRLIAFENCRDVRLEGIHLVNSPSWTVHPLACERVLLRNLTIRNPADSPNTDGIDPESCRDVLIEGCDISVGDDCIAIKSGMPEGAPNTPCERITITRCRLANGHGAVVLGSEMSGGVRSVRVSDCEFVGTDRGFRFKTRRGRGGFLEDFRAERVRMERVGTPLAINMYYEYTGADGRSPEVQDRGPRPVTPTTPWIRQLHFQDITARDSGCAAGFVLGLPEQPVRDLTLINVQIHMADEAVPDRPDMAVGIERVCRQGFLGTNVAGLHLENIRIENQLGEPLVLQNVCLAGSQELGTLITSGATLARSL